MFSLHSVSLFSPYRCWPVSRMWELPSPTLIQAKRTVISSSALRYSEFRAPYWLGPLGRGPIGSCVNPPLMPHHLPNRPESCCCCHRATSPQRRPNFCYHCPPLHTASPTGHTLPLPYHTASPTGHTSPLPYHTASPAGTLCHCHITPPPQQATLRHCHINCLPSRHTSPLPYHIASPAGYTSPLPYHIASPADTLCHCHITPPPQQTHFATAISHRLPSRLHFTTAISHRLPSRHTLPLPYHTASPAGTLCHCHITPPPQQATLCHCHITPSPQQAHFATAISHCLSSKTLSHCPLLPHSIPHLL
nr:PREDICTED: pollen-specific leucine-rich repeat extensin-like protein 1 [Latimeria chalumnae]|eukprot:XP_014339695.1 PREDICTED: pollen-specific leucine-rich repeat extensin-like protein 1 [Latimeria chalumnae]